MKRTSISAGLFIPPLLKAGGVTVPVFPCASKTDAKASYIVYTRKSWEGRQVKESAPADGVVICVWIYHPDYASSIELAEQVRESIEGKQARLTGLEMRSATMIDSSDTWDADSYVQYIEFLLKIN